MQIFKTCACSSIGHNDHCLIKHAKFKKNHWLPDEVHCLHEHMHYYVWIYWHSRCGFRWVLFKAWGDDWKEINHQNQTSVDILIKMESAIGNMQVNCFSSIPWVTPSPLSDLRQQHLQQTEDAIVSQLLHTKNMPCHFTTIT